MSIAAPAPQVATSPSAYGDWMRRFRGLGLLERGALIGLAVITLIAIFGPLIVPHSVNLPSGKPLAAPTLNHLFGTDDIGRDVFSRVIAGVRLTWIPALIVIVIAVFVGGTIGLISGAIGGWTDRGLQRLTDLFLVLPSTLIAIAVIAALGPGQAHTVIAISIFWWPWYSRIVRNETRADGRPPARRGRSARGRVTVTAAAALHPAGGDPGRGDHRHRRRGQRRPGVRAVLVPWPRRARPRAGVGGDVGPGPRRSDHRVVDSRSSRRSPCSSSP